MVTLYVEGGGDGRFLPAECRRGFTEFLKKAGLAGRMPRVIACGGRQNAYEKFNIAIKAGEKVFLLVDSEDVVPEKFQNGDSKDWSPWKHLAEREGDKWEKPVEASDLQCHLMVRCMENWFLADRNTLKKFFGSDFNDRQLPAQNREIETVDKNDVDTALAGATRDSSKGEYDKGKHSFDILSKINPTKVTDASPWAARFIDELKRSL